MFDFAKELKSYLQRQFITDRKDWSINGSEVFEHYWRNYLRNEDAERMGIKRPYANLEEYFRWKERQQKRKR